MFAARNRSQNDDNHPRFDSRPRESNTALYESDESRGRMVRQRLSRFRSFVLSRSREDRAYAFTGR
jgi:hypothetical protein